MRDAEMLDQTIKAYQNRAIVTAQVIEHLIDLAKTMRAAHQRGEDLKMSEEELAFYDALEVTVLAPPKGAPQADEDATAEALRAVGPHLQSVIGRQVRMKYTPHLVFREDPAMKTGERVDEILRRLHSEGE